VESAVPRSGGGKAQENKLLFSRALAVVQPAEAIVSKEKRP
jgi:hypothetical protein